MIEAVTYQDFEQQDINRSQEQLNSWINNPGWDQLAIPYLPAGETLDNTNPANRLRQITAISDANWDFRKGQERMAVDWDEGELGDPNSEVGQQIMTGGDQLHMIDTVYAEKGHNDFGIYLGGSNRSLPQRDEHLSDQEGVTFDRKMFLGSTRPISDTEKKAVADFAPDAVTEADVARAWVEHTLKLNGTTFKHRRFPLTRIGYKAMEGHEQTVDVYKTAAESIFVLCAPAPDEAGRDRANTTDTLRMFRNFAYNHLDEDTKTVISTNSIYRFQEVDAQKELTDKTGTPIEMTVFSADRFGVNRTPKSILMEARSLLRSIAACQQEINNRRSGLASDRESAQWDYASEEYIRRVHPRVAKRIAKLERSRRQLENTAMLAGQSAVQGSEE